MSGLAAVLARRHDPGVFLWHAAFGADEVRHTVEHAGWQFGYVDGWGSESEAEFHARVAATLGFPDHGADLDALGDRLSDLDQPTVLLWDGWGPLARAVPERFPRILRVLYDRSVEGSPFAVLLRGEGPDVDVPSLD
jgi:RNAse (barnase) inhibitor barstar